MAFVDYLMSTLSFKKHSCDAIKLIDEEEIIPPSERNSTHTHIYIYIYNG